MLDIANVVFNIGVPPPGEAELELLASRIFDEWDAYLVDILPLPDYAVRFELAEGSLNGKGKVAATALAIYMGVANFGGFVSGVREIAHLSRVGGEFLLHEAKGLIPAGETATLRGHRNAGRMAQLERLFVKVQRQQLTPDAAMEAVEKMLEDEDVPDPFRNEMAAAIRNLPKLPKQLDLPLDSMTEPVTPTSGSPKPSSAPRPNRIPAVPPPTRFRVEIWRESRSDKRHIRVAPL